MKKALLVLGMVVVLAGSASAQLVDFGAAFVGTGSAGDLNAGFGGYGYAELYPSPFVSLRATALAYGGSLDTSWFYQGNYVVAGIEGSILAHMYIMQGQGLPGVGLELHAGGGVGAYAIDVSVNDGAFYDPYYGYYYYYPYDSVRYDQSVDDTVGLHVLGGASYIFHPNFSVFVDVKYTFMDADAHKSQRDLTTGNVVTEDKSMNLDTVSVGVGAALRF